MQGPDLFVVCKNCQAEVSPYITECPYCGHRLRKRAPKLEKGMGPALPKPPRVPRVPRRRPSGARPSPRSTRERGEPPSWSRGRRPYGTIFLVVASIALTMAVKAGLAIEHLVMGFGGDDPWLPATSAFVYFRNGYEVVTLGGIFLFGWLLERRLGMWAPLFIFAACGIGGLYVVDLIEPDGAMYLGANGAALGLLGVWAARDITLRRRGEDPESDGLGAVVMAVVLILMPVVAEEAHAVAGAAGGAIGFVLGFPLARLTARS